MYQFDKCFLLNNKDFAEQVEKLIKPVEVGTIHTVQQLNGLLPKPIQNSIMKSSGKKFPQMGFVVEPYSTFLFYEIVDLDAISELLPEGFKLIKTSVFDNDEPKYYVIFGSFRAHTSAFWGSRMEFYAVAEDENTGLLTWIILDYDTNTIGYDKKNGLRAPNCKNAVITINHRGKVFVDFTHDDNSRTLKYTVEVEKGEMRDLDQRLWLEGNLSVSYGKELNGSKEEVFSLKFEPCEVEKALYIPLDAVEIESNSWLPGVFKPSLSVAACFPYAQHFISDSPGFTSRLKNRSELETAVEQLDFSKIEVFSTKDMKILFIVGMALSFLTTMTMLFLILFG